MEDHNALTSTGRGKKKKQSSSITMVCGPIPASYRVIWIIEWALFSEGKHLMDIIPLNDAVVILRLPTQFSIRRENVIQKEREVPP